MIGKTHDKAEGVAVGRLPKSSRFAQWDTRPHMMPGLVSIMTNHPIVPIRSSRPYSTCMCAPRPTRSRPPPTHFALSREDQLRPSNDPHDMCSSKSTSGRTEPFLVFLVADCAGCLVLILCQTPTGNFATQVFITNHSE